MKRASDVRSRLKESADPAKAAFLPRFFKTGPGDYGEGDRFYGVTVPECRRIARAGEPERDQALALLATLDTTHYRLLFDAAKFFWDERVYGTADEYAARASYVDPVDPELLELRQLLRERRIRYRASDMTNTWPSPSSPPTR